MTNVGEWGVDARDCRRRGNKSVKAVIQLLRLSDYALSAFRLRVFAALLGFEVINHAQFETEHIFDRLINETEIQWRLDFMAERTLRVVQGIMGVI